MGMGSKPIHVQPPPKPDLHGPPQPGKGLGQLPPPAAVENDAGLRKFWIFLLF
jgi:hypothetical protein